MSQIFKKETESELFHWGRNGNQALIAFSLQGKSHKQSNMPLQDNHALRLLPNGWSLLVVCDGVGSNLYSDRGSRIAANSFADFVVQYLGSFLNAESLFNLMISAAHYATGKLKDVAFEEGNPIREYNTTLHAAIYANGMVYYFHSGDGGIIVLNSEGTFQSLTEPQKDQEYVIPLLSNPENWEVGQTDTRVQSVLLCTDGVYDKLAGAILRKHGDGLDKGLCTFFLSPWCFDFWEEPEHIAEAMSSVFSDQVSLNNLYEPIVKGVAQGKQEHKIPASQFVLDWVYANNYPLESLQGIQDDITIAILQNTAERPAEQPMEYFKGPDWKTIQKNVYARLYGNTLDIEIPNWTPVGPEFPPQR